MAYTDPFYDEEETEQEPDFDSLAEQAEERAITMAEDSYENYLGDY